ncbi:uncharacterized protein OCT59_013675 [Rhizophagus irregularis]|uniref:MIR domain-containing protein n=1 Tax=Rhizophagus irregularis (strain DAOM 197198w) TaxID=1432141 RepID=A0A015NCQ8_RHIIW|nr:hypothetical protein RirG_027710 [Rhizophagus irregularis DAOM 197198w]UZO21277.1 hypothetical protein OCT59_013675 [Rhizophagus irregularis]
MDFPKYNGNAHPDEWIKDLQNYLEYYRPIKDSLSEYTRAKFALSLVDSNILLPTEIDSIVKVRNALKEDISFTLFKNTNKRKLQSLKYIPESRGGDTSKFISNFLKLCYNAEINDIEEQKNYLCKSLPMNEYFSNEFYTKMKNVNSLNELIKKFEDIAVEESNLIKNYSIVALKHVGTGKYLSSTENFYYTTGSKFQLIFAGSPVPDSNSLWKIKFGKELATYNNTSIRLQHVKSSNKFLGIYYSIYDGCYYKSPSTNHTEVSCNSTSHISNHQQYWNENWKFNDSKLENRQGYLKSNDIINLSIKKSYVSNNLEFLRSHDIQFTIGNDTFQEVVCHNERLGGNDEWCIELIKQHIWTIDT